MLYVATYSGWLAVLSTVCWLTGDLLMRGWLDGRALGRWRPLARIVLGLGGWTAALFLLAAAGQLRRPVVVSLAALVVVLGLWRLRGRLARLAGWRCRPPAGVHVLAGAALAAVLSPLYVMAMSPTVSWDAAVYHLNLPKLYLEAGGFRPVTFNVYSNWPLNVELLFAGAMLAEDYVLAKLVHFGFGLLTLWAIYLAGRGAFRRRASGRAAGWLGASLFLANGVVAYEMRVAYVDLAHAFFFLAAFLFLRRSLSSAPDADRALLLAGLCGGLMAGVKLNGVAGAAILATLFLPHLVASARAGTLAAALRRLAIRYALPVLTLWSPWLLKSAWTTGNPIYPFLFGGPDWSPRLSAQLQVWQRSIGMGREPLDYLLLPFRVILEGDVGYQSFDGRLGVFWLVAVPVALWVARRRRLVRQGLWVAGLYFVFWALSSQQARLLIPVLPLAAVAAAVAILDVVERVSSSVRPLARRAALLAGLVLAVGMGTEAAPGLSRGRFLDAAGKALGRFAEAGADRAGLKASAVHPVYRFIDERLPPDAKLLLLNTNQAFFCQRELLADSFFEASQIADWLAPARDAGELRELLAARGVTHLLVEHRERGIPYPVVLLEMLRDPRHVETLATSPEGRFSVLELRPSRGG